MNDLQGNHEHSSMRGASFEIDQLRRGEFELEADKARHLANDPAVFITHLQSEVASLAKQQEELMDFLKKFKQKQNGN